MSEKVKKEFVFQYPLKHKVVRDLKIVTEHVGDLTVEGIGYFNPLASPIDVFDRYTVDIDYVKWNGTDINRYWKLQVVLKKLKKQRSATLPICWIITWRRQHKTTIDYGVSEMYAPYNSSPLEYD